MRIGIDFDNTIADYNFVFKKVALKEKFINCMYDKYLR